MRKLLLRPFVPLALAGLVFACSQNNTGDEPAAASSAPTGIEAFLLFPNPIGLDPLAQNGGTFETDTTAYAEAYYRAIDLNNDKDTLDKWRAQNGFTGYATPARGGTEHLAVFRDVKDLGYGRRMTARRNIDDGSVAFYVENYSVQPNSSGDYSSSLNVEAAIRRDTQWHVGTNAIEWSTATCSAAELLEGCDPTAKFAKYYNFSSADGTRQLAVDLDGKGKKAMPGPCISCHGGRGDPLTPPDASGNPRFPLVENSVSRKRGDVQARLHGQNVDSFGFSTQQAGFTKPEQQAKLKDFNQWILCTYPAPVAGTTVAGTWGTCTRPTAGPNEWQGTAAEMIEQWYGGPTMSASTFLDNYVPSGWSGNPSLYTNVVAPFCRTCHILRGTANQSDIDFTTLTKFEGYADRIKTHVFDRGNMPLALIVYEDFWKSSAPDALANFLDPFLPVGGKATSASGAALKPGRPVANPGPNRMVRTGVDAKLSAANSLLATSYSWTPVSGPTTPLITSTSPTSPEATFQASTAGAYTVQLTVSDGARTDSKNIVITVDNTFPDPSTIRFAQIQNVIQNVLHNGTTTCTSCHSTPPGSPMPPIFYNGFDRNGSGGAADATDLAWFLKEVSGRVNLTEIDASPLLRKPSGNHHNGGTLFDLATTAGLRNYSIFYNWILAGIPAGGVVANAGADTSPTVTFSGGPPLSASFALDGSQSVGATSFLWSVVSGPNGPLGTPPSITNATSAAATLNVFNAGTYVVQLQASDSVSTDTDQRIITVSETALAFNVSVAGLSGGTVSVPFSGAPLAGTIAVNATQNAGSPVSCTWQVNAVTPGASGITVGTNSCSGATLNVSSSAIGNTYSVTLTQQNVSLPPVAVTSSSFTVAAAGGSNPSGANFTFPTSNIGFTINGSLVNAPVARINGVTTNNVTLIGSASGPGTLNFTWSLPSGAGTAGCSIASPGPSTSNTVALRVSKAGSCSVTLTVGNGILPNSTATNTVTIGSSVLFPAIGSLLTNAGCTSCHVAPGNATIPNWTNDAGLFGRLTGELNVVLTATPQTSRLLVCPSVGCNTMTGNRSTFSGADFSGYDSVLTWITNGATNP